MFLRDPKRCVERKIEKKDSETSRLILKLIHIETEQNK